ncbi:hypothetical protein [Wolbachia endosymbiont of Ctenocephalides felis wCfeT]|uniref:hypothetical protein n=1 Tax=Wolbachia endosymbiont of Ctenocephalides felis wCfeT TaxID=2732593 RepID=UPI001445823C|nr:hypothetical protein [Wolbachia endosymbiont of Ctenocephalides felis wCfeT]
MKKVKLLVLSLGVVTLVSSAAIMGTLAGLALSFTNLSPFVVGGIIGAAYPFLLLFIANPRSAFRCIDWSINFLEECCDDGTLGEFGEELVQELEEGFEFIKEDFDSARHYVRNIIEIGFCFGVGVGLVALGFASPAAIGALATIVSIVAYPLLNCLTDKTIKCFSTRKLGEPNSLLSEQTIEGVIDRIFSKSFP